MDSVSEHNLTFVMPELAKRIRAIADAFPHLHLRAIQGLRTYAQQDALYAQGRNGNMASDGQIKNLKPVTNARGGYSYHNFGLAVDMVPSFFDLTKPFTPDWNPHHPAWVAMEDEGLKQGLCEGAKWRSFPDFPHFQLTGPFPMAAPNDACRSLVANGNLQPVWDAVMNFYKEQQNGNTRI